MSDRRVEDCPIKFGPMWLRNFSREGSAGGSGPGTTGGAPPGNPSTGASNRPQTQHAKYKLAQHRYGREEMLALYENDLDPPAGLQAFEPLYVPHNQRPLALTTDTLDDDPREHSRNVGLHRNAGAAGPGGGPGSERFGRGLSDLSRGRGRPHQPYTLTGTDRPTLYRDDNPYGEPPTPGLTRSWSSGPNAPLGRSATDNPDWNQNRPYKSRWPEPNWRSQSGRAGGEESEPARRALVPLGRPRQPLDKRDKEKGDRPTSWAPSRRAWSGEPQFDDNLPEWATEGDTEASGGTFDSSGAFHDVDAPSRRSAGDSFYGLSRSHTQGSLGARSRSHDEENATASEPRHSWCNSDKPPDAAAKKFDATYIKFKKQPQSNEETSSSEKYESSFEASDDQFEKAVAKAKNLKIDDTQTDSKKKMVSFNEEKFGQSKTFDALTRMNIQADEANDDRGNFNSVLLTTNNSLRQKHQHMMPQPLGQAAAAQPQPPAPERTMPLDSTATGLPLPEEVGASNPGGGARLRGLDAFAVFSRPATSIEGPSTQGAFQPFSDPSILKLHEGTPYPSGLDTQDILKNATLQMVKDSNTWYYEDPQKIVQGPFTPSEMYQWYRAGFFSPDLMIRRACDKQMRSLGSFGKIPPFAETYSELLAFLAHKIMVTDDGTEKPEVQQPTSDQLQTSQLQQMLMSQVPMQQSQMPQSQLLQSQLQESQRQQLHLQQSQLLQLQLQQSQLQQSQLEQSQIPQSYLQQPQLPQSQLHQASLQQSQILPSHLKQSMLPQAQLHPAPMPQPLLPQSQHPQAQLHQPHIPQSQLHPLQMPQSSLQDILMNKTPMQPQPVSWNTPHPFVSPAMMSTNMSTVPTPSMTFGNRTHSTFLEQIIQPQRTPVMLPEMAMSEPQTVPEDPRREAQLSPSDPLGFSFLSRPPPPLAPAALAVKPDVAEGHRLLRPLTPAGSEAEQQYFDNSAAQRLPETPVEDKPAKVAPSPAKEVKSSPVKKVEPAPVKERDPAKVTQINQVAVETKPSKVTVESKEKTSKSKETKGKTKSSKTKDRQDESGDRKSERPEVGKVETKMEEMSGFTKVVNKKEEKQSKKDKKEVLQEIPAATKASQRKNPDKKKSEEGKAAEDADRKRKEELQRNRIVEDLKEESFFINNLEMKYKQMEAQLDKAHQQPHAAAAGGAGGGAAAASRKAPWCAPGPAMPAANTDGLSLAEIQKLEREKKFESIKEQQQMMQLIAQQQQAALAREQEIQQSSGYNWAKYKANDMDSVQSLAEIQEETRRRQLLEMSRQEPAAPPPPAAAPAAQAPWSNGGSSYLGGFWESSPGAAGAAGRPDEKPSPKKTRPEQQPSKAVKKAAATAATAAAKAVPSPAKKSSPAAEFESWCLKVLAPWSGNIDVPVFVGFLKDIESAYEVKDYVKSYLGETKDSTDFARNFLEKRSKLMRGTYAQSVDDLSAPAAAKNPASGAASDFQEVKGKGKKVKKNKMLKIDTRILGFSVTAAENRINVGDIESL